MPSIGTYCRSDRLLNCRIGGTNRWDFWLLEKDGFSAGNFRHGYHESVFRVVTNHLHIAHILNISTKPQTSRTFRRLSVLYPRLQFSVRRLAPAQFRFELGPVSSSHQKKGSAPAAYLCGPCPLFDSNSYPRLCKRYTDS